MSKISKFFSTPLGQTVTMCGLILMGILGSLYAEVIKAPFDFIEKTTPENWIYAGCYWLVLFGLFVFFFSGQIALKHAEEKRQAALKENVDTLQRLINTMPPDSFLSDYPQVAKKGFELVKAVLQADKPDRAFVELSIQGLIQCVLTLAKRYDSDLSAGEVLYAGNIMMFQPPEEKKEIQFFPDLDSSKVVGHLKLCRELTATSDEEGSVDGEVPEITLPVFTDEPGAAEIKEMPGAPLAFVINSPMRIVNTQSLQDLLEKQNLFAPDVRTAIGQYFDGPAKEIRSFMSFPIPWLPDFKGPRRPIAILNVHRNTRGMLQDEALFKQFIWIISPFIEYIYLMLTIWKESEKREKEDREGHRSVKVNGKSLIVKELLTIYIV